MESVAEREAQSAKVPRLDLVPLAPAHAAALHPLLDDWAVAKMLARVPCPIALEDVAAFAAKRREDTGETAFALLADGAPIGVGGVKHPGSGETPRRMPRLGYWIGRRYWGLGYGTEAVAALTALAFDLFPEADLAGAGVFLDNPASRRVLEKVGFQEAGRYETPSLSRGAAIPTADMHLARARWAASEWAARR